MTQRSENRRLHRPPAVWVTLLAILVLSGGAATAAIARTGRATARGPVVLETDVQSKYSHIRVKRQGNVRSMIFVRDSGEEAVESMVNLKKPYDLLLPYSRFMFASYLFQPKQRQILIVGLGGGGMVHFYRHYDPEVVVEAVEIDPDVVEIADRYFEVRADRNTRIVTDDAFHFLDAATTRYDVIYMDAFLKPSRDTDATGLPLRLKTIQFYKGLQDKIATDGLIVINLNVHHAVGDDLETIRSALPQVYVFRAQNANLIAICSLDKSRVGAAALRDRAKELDRRFKASFSFAELLNNLAKGP